MNALKMDERTIVKVQRKVSRAVSKFLKETRMSKENL
jgi:hypothetical protein